LLVLLFVGLAGFGLRVSTATPQTTLEWITLLKSQNAAIEKEIAAPPARADFPDTYRVVLRQWQDCLAGRFSAAATTVEEIIKVDPANAETWRELLETLRLYSQPISSPDQRTVFGDGEVQKRARVIDSPLAAYTDEARANKIRGEVRLRLVLASDGTVKNVFPIKSLGYGLTESAMEAARKIRFEPAVRKDQPASQFATFVSEFKKGKAKPYIPRSVF
jgi:TonB family protein